MKTIIFCLFILVSCNDKTDGDTPQSEASKVSEVVNTPPGGSPSTTPTPAPVTGTVPSPIPTSTPAFTTEFVRLLNNYRTSVGLRALILNQGLSLIAQDHSDDMAGFRIPFGHDGFSNRCFEAYRVLGGGNMCGENVAAGQTTPRIVFDAWMNSPGHRSNIDEGRYTHMGFAFQTDSQGLYYWTHLFLQKQ